MFTTREAAEEFAKGDPFVVNGVIRNWFVRDWDEGLA
ncbi:YCII-related domain-containing protein [Kibdelosporangium persicum]